MRNIEETVSQGNVGLWRSVEKENLERKASEKAGLQGSPLTSNKGGELMREGARADTCG